MKIERHNKPDLEFEGEEVGCASSKWINGKEQNRWTEHSLYKLDNGKFILYEKYITLWQGELGYDNYRVFESEEELHNFAVEDASDLETECIKEYMDVVVVIS